MAWTPGDPSHSDPDRCTAGQADMPTACTWHPQHHWCTTCEGYYGVPHDGIHEGAGAHPRGRHDAAQCACRPCRHFMTRVPR